MKTVQLQLERLHRHHEFAVRTYDHVSLLDLSSTLRIWTELAKPLSLLCPTFAQAISFKTGRPGSKLKKMAKGRAFVYATFPDGVNTYASNGEIFSDPGSILESWSANLSVHRSEDRAVFFEYCVIRGVAEQLTTDTVIKRCNFQEWLGAEAVRMSYFDAENKLCSFGISREMLVKRVANTLDGSHASVSEEGNENWFDEAVHHLLQFKVGGLPLPYFVLLKIAQDILKIAPKHMA